jgi:hypothetical protein
MKPAWIVAFALPVLSSLLSHPQQTSSNVPANQPSSDAKATATPEAQDVVVAPINTEEDLRQALVGKQLFIRQLWLDDDLHFNMYGDLASTSPKGSFTLCAVEIDHVHLTKRRVELEGVRYGIHFEDEGNWAEQATSFDRIRVTPKKKHMSIIIDRQQVVVPKKEKGKAVKPGPAPLGASGQTERATATSDTPATPPAPTSAPSTSPGGNGKDEAEVTTLDPAKAAEQLRYAVNRIFSPALDAKMVAAMPDYWKYFYQAQIDHKSIEPTDPNIVRPGPGIDGPKLMKNLVASSNGYAQQSQIAGVASYKVILGPDGKPLAVAVYRPIGFGLDENGVEAIQKSTFTPATKDGKAMTSVIDVSINFRIYSKLTAAPPANATQDAADTANNVSPVTGKPALPGLFTVQSEAAQAHQ